MDLGEAIRRFEAFAVTINKPSPYRPVLTEVTGMTNIAIGSVEALASLYLKHRGSKHLSNFHWKLAKETVYIGLWQFMPGFLVASGACYLTKRAIYPYTNSLASLQLPVQG